MESSLIGAARVRPLPLQLANQIAAGEVVERPASVVKELLENSLDAGARRVEIEAEAGGTRLIRVRDDGTGIHHDDLVLAVGRHATSKISCAADLAAIASLGFRGEALASIAAVSRLRLSSSLVGERGGWTLAVDTATGAPGVPVPAAHPPGTTVEVRDLFYNTPARRKFLRTEKTEFGHVDELVRRVALSYFETALVLTHNRRAVHNLTAAADAGARDRRVARLCGRAFLEASRRIDFEAAGLRLWGWLGGAQYSRGQADLQYFYVNGRIIRDRIVTHALRQAYEGHLYPGRHPAYILHLAIDPIAVDVNVHPTKHEVRFHETRRVHDFLVRSVDEALRRDLDSAPPMYASTSVSFAGGGRLSGLGAKRGITARDATDAYAALRSGLPRGDELRNVAPAGRGDGPLGRPIAVLHDTYLLTQARNGPVLVDIAAALEFLAKRALQAGTGVGEVRSQPLLVPCRLSCSRDEAERAEYFQATLQSLGVELDRTGPAELLLRRLPAALLSGPVAVMRGSRVEMLVQDVLMALGELAPRTETAAAREQLQSVLARQAGRCASPLDIGEQEALLGALEAQAGIDHLAAGNRQVGRDETGRILWTELSPACLAPLFDR